ncbi:hypothetical protein H5410_041921 [Solanum commersonii]|uniref:Uncharacterized protein n=1 Tax=Solanum commersonii TaxID=4109 RepID=A0A9J5XUY6_SOLCO|nr:hypothetical protein H5410_041921 [Solanum commersonii]
MPHPSRILQKYTTFGESDTHPLAFLKSPSNIFLLPPTRQRKGLMYSYGGWIYLWIFEFLWMHAGSEVTTSPVML